MFSAFETCAVGQNLYLHLAQPDIPVHCPIADKAVGRALKARGLVFLEAKVTHPGKAVAAEQAVQQILRLASCNQHGQTLQAQAAADKMQAAASLVAQLG